MNIQLQINHIAIVNLAFDQRHNLLQRQLANEQVSDGVVSEAVSE